MMKIENERLELSDELSRHIFSSGPENGLKLIRDLPDLTAKARGNCLLLEGSHEKILLVKRFLEILGQRIEQHEAVNSIEIRRLFSQITSVKPLIEGVAGDLNF